MIGFASQMIGLGKYIALVVAVLSLIYAAVKMTFGRGQRHHMAAEGASSIPWAAAGIALAMSAVTVVTFFADR
ncbi:hypothetical protein [Sphaerisporangium flaviroseum]|uniref:hypothetical protein n=1 Tax=Sphaerisporangium flaviroseum TaxID=509199 RepID=UPI0031EBB1C3